MNGQPRFTILGKLISFVLVLGLIGLGVYMIRARSGSGGSGTTTAPAEGGGTAPEVSEVKVEVPRLSPPAAFQFKDNIVPIEISEYAGYAGLIAANGGLEPTENSAVLQEPRIQGPADDQRRRDRGRSSTRARWRPR